MPRLLKKCFLFHYDPSINSDKVFNLFIIDNEDGTYSAISEFGRSGTKLNVKSLIENCSLLSAHEKYTAKLNEKVYHRNTPYTHTLNSSGSPTFKKFSENAASKTNNDKPAEVFEFKSFTAEHIPIKDEKKSGGQNETEETKQPKKIGVLNLNQLDALEI